MTQRVRVGLIGCGSIAQQMHLPYLAELEEYFEIRALCDLSAKTVHALSHKYRVDCAVTDYRRLLQEELDAVFVLTSTARADVVAAAAEAGCHLFVEKPMAYSLQEADLIVDACSRHGVHLMVGYMKMYDAGYQRGRELMLGLDGLHLIRSHDVIGPNRMFVDDVATLIRHRDIDPEELARGRREIERRVAEAIGEGADPALVRAYHVMLGLSVHDMSILRGAFGSPKRVTSTEIWNDGRNFASILDYGPGTRCIFEAGHLNIKKFDEELTAYANDEVVSIKFPSPFIKNAPTMVHVWRMDGDDYVETEILASYEEAFKRELVHFHSVIVNDHPPLTSGEEAREDIAVLIQMIQAA